jgi:hypothetical protein
MSRRAEVWALAPVAPPCFDARLQWLEFLVSAAEEQRPGRQQVLILRAGEPARLNWNFNFCRDCELAHRAAMTDAGRCRPNWLMDMQPKTTTQENEHAT